MHEDERDLLEALIFEEIEETVGTWLRAIIQRLEREQTAIRTDHRERRTPGGEKLKGTLLYQRRHPNSAKPAWPTALDRRQVLPISGRSGFGKLV